MEKIIKEFRATMSNSDFVNLIIQLDSIDNEGLCEDDEECLCDFYNGLYKICDKQIDSNLKNGTFLVNRRQTIGDFMSFLRLVNL